MTPPIRRPTFRVRFERVGRHQPGAVPDLVVEARDAEHLADRIYRYIRRRLASHEVLVDVNLTAGTGTIWAGGRPAGEFTFTRVEAPHGDLAA